jgi:enoyl-CoA hydratase/carnithine racemase
MNMIEVTKQGPVEIITMSRPERRNALGSESIRALRDALRQADRDSACSAIVLTGAPPAFCAGSDLKELGGLSIEEMRDHEAATAAVAREIGYLVKPVVAAVEGYALGGGFILATSCDVVVSANEARWHLPEVKIGWLPPWGLQTLLARVGPVRARLLTWGPEPIDGAEALRLGVADYAVPQGSVLEKAVAIAEALASLPNEAVASTKRFFAPIVTSAAEALDAEASRVFGENCTSDTAQATLKRFQVKS